MAKSTTRRKTTTTRKPAAKPAPAAKIKLVDQAAGGAEVVQDTDMTDAPAADGVLRKRELIDRVVEVSGQKKKFVKPIVESMLTVLGDALSNGEELNLQPLGKVRVNRKKDVSNGEVLVTKIRRSAQATEGGEKPLAEPEE